MRGAAKPNKRERAHSASSRSRKLGTDSHRAGGDGADDRPCCLGASAREEVGWTPDLAVAMVGCAGAAETAAAVEDGAVC